MTNSLLVTPGARLWRKIAFTFLVIFAFILPWQNMIFFKGAGSIGRFFALATITVCVVAVLVRGRFRTIRLIHVLIGCFALWVILSILWSDDVTLSLTRSLTMLQAVAIVWMVWEFARNPERQRTLLQAYVLGAYVVIGGTAYSFLTGGEIGLATERYAAEGFNPNFAGAILALGVPIAWYLALIGERVSVVWVNRLYVLTAIVGILLTGTRTAFIAVLVSLPFAVSTLRSLGFRERIIAVVVYSTSLLMLAPIIPVEAFERISTIGSEVTSGDLNNRVYAWKAGIEVVMDHPVLGVGAGGFEEAAAPAVYSVLGTSLTAHNAFLSVLVELGPVGFMLFCSIVLTMFFMALQGSSLDRWFWGTLLISWSLLAMLGDREYDEATWMLFGLLIAANSHFRLRRHRNRTTRRVSRIKMSSK